MLGLDSGGGEGEGSVGTVTDSVLPGCCEGAGEGEGERSCDALELNTGGEGESGGGNKVVAGGCSEREFKLSWSAQRGDNGVEGAELEEAA